MEPIYFSVAGEPEGKGRPRATTVNGRARMYTPAKTKSYEDRIKLEAAVAMQGQSLMSGPVRVEVDMCFKVPGSWSNMKKHDAVELSRIRPTKKPDVDNVLKAVCDAMNGVVYEDDAQVVEVRMSKYFVEGEGYVLVWVHQLTAKGSSAPRKRK